MDAVKAIPYQMASALPVISVWLARIVARLSTCQARRQRVSWCWYGGKKNAPLLCVDDYKSILGGRKISLEGEGYRVSTAAESRRALWIFTSHPLNEVVLDYEIPGMSGDMVARE